MCTKGKYIYIFAKEEDNAGTAVVLMGGGNNYHSGLFQLLFGVYCDWKLSWLSRIPTHFWQIIVLSEYGHCCNKASDLAFGECRVILVERILRLWSCSNSNLPDFSAMIAMIYIFMYRACIIFRHGYKFYAPCSMLCCCMCTCFVPNVILSIFDKFCRHCPGYCVLVGLLDSGRIYIFLTDPV